MADKAKGLITLLRDIQGHWLWKYKPFSKGQAWVDILLSANHKDGMVPLGNEVVLVKRGEFITSQFKLAEKWGWGRQQVRVFLELLQNPNPDAPMVVCQNLTKKATKITILNYSDLQKFPTKITTNAQPTHNQDLTINNKYKNDKNDKNITYNHSTSNWENITEGDKKAWQEAYPACNIDIELAKMREWVKGAGAKGHKSQWRKFITNWLSRSQEKGGTKTKEAVYGKGPASLRENQEERRRGLERGTREIT